MGDDFTNDILVADGSLVPPATSYFALINLDSAQTVADANIFATGSPNLGVLGAGNYELLITYSYGEALVAGSLGTATMSSTASYTLTAIPEPACTTLLASISVLFFCHFIRRRARFLRNIS